MDLSKIYELYHIMKDDYTLLSFKGIVNEEILNALFTTVETKLKIVEDSLEKRKKIYNIIVECYQNLYHHSDELEKEHEAKSIFSKAVLMMISKSDTGYEIKTGNYIHKTKSGDLKKRLNNINEMNEEELREFHTEILKSGERTTKGTAGLGLIDIARKSNHKLNYDFITIDANYDFFCLGIQI